MQGSNNYVQGSNSYVQGSNNYVQCSNNYVQGSNNYVQGSPGGEVGWLLPEQVTSIQLSSSQESVQSLDGDASNSHRRRNNRNTKYTIPKVFPHDIFIGHLHAGYLHKVYYSQSIFIWHLHIVFPGRGQLLWTTSWSPELVIVHCFKYEEESMLEKKKKLKK